MIFAQESAAFGSHPELLAVLPYAETLEDNEAMSASGLCTYSIIHDLKDKAALEPLATSRTVPPPPSPVSARHVRDVRDADASPLVAYTFCMPPPAKALCTSASVHRSTKRMRRLGRLIRADLRGESAARA